LVAAFVIPKKKNQRQLLATSTSATAHCSHVIQVDAGCFPDGFTTFGCVFKDCSNFDNTNDTKEYLRSIASTF
jgi:hypothetical protein